MIDHIECLFELLHFISDFIDRMFEILILFQYFTWIWSWLNMAKTLLVALLKCNTFINSTVNSKSVISVLSSIDHIAAQFYLPVKKMFLGGASNFLRRVPCWPLIPGLVSWSCPSCLRSCGKTFLISESNHQCRWKHFQMFNQLLQKNILKCPTNQPNK